MFLLCDKANTPPETDSDDGDSEAKHVIATPHSWSPCKRPITPSTDSDEGDPEVSAMAKSDAVPEHLRGTLFSPSNSRDNAEKFEDQMQASAQSPAGADKEMMADVVLVSLGCFCGVKASCDKLGYRQATLPFDWIRTRHEGVVQYLTNNFEGFHDWNTDEPVPDIPGMRVFRDNLHSFWWDDPTLDETVEKYNRRIARLGYLDADSRPVLFVRAVACSAELSRAAELFDAVVDFFGSQARLLMIVDYQKATKGAFVVEEHPAILFYFLGPEARDTYLSTPYLDPIKCGLNWMNGEGVSATVMPSVEALAGRAEETKWGVSKMAGVMPFEPQLEEGL